MHNLQLHAEGKYGKTNIKLNVAVFLFKEEGLWYAYSPAFDLNGYGKNKTEARSSLELTLDEFLDYTIKKDTSIDEMVRLGWKFIQKENKFVAPKVSELIEKNDDLREIVDNKKYTSDDYSLEVEVPIPA